MIARLLMLLCLARLPLCADAEQDITAVVSTLASALSGHNPELFMKTLDRDMPVYQQIDREIHALLSATDVACTVEVLTNAGTPSVQTADLDWYMSLKSQQDENLIERRRTKVTIKIEKRGKKWLVTSFSPISVFAAMTAR